MVSRHMELSDREFILDPSRWPAWPALPLRRSIAGRGPESGILMNGKFTIYIVNMFHLADMTPLQVEQVLASCKKYEYASVDALLSDGWQVD